MGVRYYGYEEFVKDLKILCNKISYDYDAILAIARGGLTMAHLMGEFFNERRVFTLNSIGYEESRKREKVEVFNLPDLSNAKKVLIVDDIVDSGDTILEVKASLKRLYPFLKSDVATLFFKESAKFKPTFFVNYANEWIDFFWTKDIR